MRGIFVTWHLRGMASSWVAPSWVAPLWRGTFMAWQLHRAPHSGGLCASFIRALTEEMRKRQLEYFYFVLNSLYLTSSELLFWLQNTFSSFTRLKGLNTFLFVQGTTLLKFLLLSKQGGLHFHSAVVPHTVQLRKAVSAQALLGYC